LSDFLGEKKFSDEVLDATGLFYERRHPQGRFFPRFRGRLMIPIRDVQGRVVAFTARQLAQTPEDDPARDHNQPNDICPQKGVAERYPGHQHGDRRSQIEQACHPRCIQSDDKKPH